MNNNNIKKYHLNIIGATMVSGAIVEAEYFQTTTNSSTTSGYYGFYINREIVACYPINRTIIWKIEHNNEQQ